MTSTSSSRRAIAELRAAVDAVLVADPIGLGEDELTDVVRELEVQRRRLTAVDHRLIAELEMRGVASSLGARDTATLLRQALRISPGDARARVRAAADLGPRRALDGQPLGPLFTHVAAATAEGSIAPAHAAIITDTVNRLPAAVPADAVVEVEASLTRYAQQFDPQQLARLARRMRDVLDPDGTLADDEDHRRARSLTLRERRDGSGELTARLTPVALATWRAVLDPLSAPASGADGERDPRNTEQRRHDGFLDAGERLLRSGTLPDCGGTPVTIAVTVSLTDLERRTGLATTAHGGTLSVAELLTQAAETAVIPVVLGDAGGILAYGRTRRLAQPGQRRALAVRDGGCSFPGCDAPPSWSQVHHVPDWVADGRTNVDQMTLACGFHHREHRRMGWTCRMTDGVPEWIPPRWVDPLRRPLRNVARQPALIARR